MHYVYILQNSVGKICKGSTSDLRRRVREHNTGNVTSTKHGVPWTLVYYEGFLNKLDALAEERFLKSGKGRERIQFLLQNTLGKDKRRGG